VPGNDDALRAIRLFAGKVADAVLAGRGIREARGSDSGAGAEKVAAAAEAPRPKARPAPAAPATVATA
jgi:small subunit ribosomal protein S2